MRYLVIKGRTNKQWLVIMKGTFSTFTCHAYLSLDCLYYFSCNFYIKKHAVIINGKLSGIGKWATKVIQWTQMNKNINGIRQISIMIFI